jgi:hypothetical protein
MFFEHVDGCMLIARKIKSDKSTQAKAVSHISLMTDFIKETFTEEHANM